MAKTFKEKFNDATHPFRSASLAKGADGDPALYMIIQSPVIGIPCDNDGSNPVYAGASSNILIYKAGVLQTGWTMGHQNASDMAIGLNNGVEPRTVAVTVLLADIGSIEIVANKAGEPQLTGKLFAVRHKAGVQGIQGVAGAAGAAGAVGPAGAAGADGDGVAVLKKTIEIKSNARGCEVVNNGSGFIRVTTDAAAHDVVEGEYLSIYYQGSNQQGLVTGLIDADTFDMDIAYVADEAAINFYSLSHLRNDANDSAQILHFPEIIPARYLPRRMALYVTDFDNDGNSMYLEADLGDKAYFTSGYNKFITAFPITANDENKVADLSAYYDSLVNTKQDVYAYIVFTSPAADVWTDFAALEIDLMISCETFD